MPYLVARFGRTKQTAACSDSYLNRTWGGVRRAIGIIGIASSYSKRICAKRADRQDDCEHKSAGFPNSSVHINIHTKQSSVTLLQSDS